MLCNSNDVKYLPASYLILLCLELLLVGHTLALLSFELCTYGGTFNICDMLLLEATSLCCRVLVLHEICDAIWSPWVIINCHRKHHGGVICPIVISLRQLDLHRIFEREICVGHINGVTLALTVTVCWIVDTVIFMALQDLSILGQIRRLADLLLGPLWRPWHLVLRLSEVGDFQDRLRRFVSSW